MRFPQARQAISGNVKYADRHVGNAVVANLSGSSFEDTIDRLSRMPRTAMTSRHDLVRLSDPAV
jgi:hypothetical protein